MNIMIIGCNRTGVGLARRLCAAGHELAVVDADSAALDALAREDWFDGLTCCGLPIDADTLTAGGMESCEAVFALTADDTVNIMVAQIAQQQYHIRQVWAQIVDSALKDAYGRFFSIWTVCPGDLTVDALYSSFLARNDDQLLAFGNDTLHFYRLPVPAAAVGQRLADFVPDGGQVLGLVCESGELVLTAEQPQRRLASGDMLVAMARAVAPASKERKRR